MDFIKEKIEDIKMAIDSFAEAFEKDTYYHKAPEKFRFPSLLTAGMRYILKARYIVAIVFAVLWIAAIIACIVANLSLSVFAIIWRTALSAIFFPILGVILMLIIMLVIFILMLVESLAKQICSLIMYNEFSLEIENPMDYAVCYFLHIIPKQKK